MNLYEVNQTAYAKLPTLSEDDLRTAEKTILQFLKNNPTSYYMMVNNDCRYYTLYHFIDTYKFKEMAKEMIDIITELGPVKSIEDEGDKLAAWIMYNGNCHVFYLFDYARGVVEV
jgi:hypothetical protein